MRSLSIVFPNVLDVGCFSHTLDHVGKNFKTPIVDKFIKVWYGSTCFREAQNKNFVVDKNRLTCSNLLPYSLVVEMGSHNHYTFCDISSFVEDEDLLPLRLKLKEILDDPPSFQSLQGGTRA